MLGVRPGIDDMVRDSGHELTYSRGQRVTDGVAMEAAMQAAGAARMEVEARLSKVSHGRQCSAPCRLLLEHLLCLSSAAKNTEVTCQLCLLDAWVSLAAEAHDCRSETRCLLVPSSSASA